MKAFDRQILQALDSMNHGASATVREVKVRLPGHRCYDSVREHLAALATADTPLVWRRKAGRNWLYRISHAGIEELERAKAGAP